MVEKTRRDKIAKAIDNLRPLVPSKRNTEKTHYFYGADQRPRHVVLEEAATHIEELHNTVRRISGSNASWRLIFSPVLCYDALDYG